MLRVKFSRLLRVCFSLCVLMLAARILLADEFWKNKPPSEWSLKQTLKLLQDSPWARQEVRNLYRATNGPDVTIDRTRAHCDPDALDPNGDCTQTRFRAPSDSSRSSQVEFSTANDVIFLVRWESSAPVEDAFAHLAELGERATAQYLSQPARTPGDRYVVTLKALEKYSSGSASPGQMQANPIGSLENDSAGTRAKLIVGNQGVAPLETERTGVGAADAAHFYFPRQVNGVPLIPMDRPSRVAFEFRGQRFSLKTHFSLTPEMLR